jgi:hypothetical protein
MHPAHSTHAPDLSFAQALLILDMAPEKAEKMIRRRAHDLRHVFGHAFRKKTYENAARAGLEKKLTHKAAQRCRRHPSPGVALLCSLE